MARRALLCWECGRGLGHVTALAAVARDLQRRGWQTMLALPPGRVPPAAPLDDLQVVAAPDWGDFRPAEFPKTNSSASMGDMLADFGMRSDDVVRRLVAAWRALTEAHRPDIVIADYAPGAVLAARGSIPCMVIGTGFSIPPRGLTSFPALHDLAPIVEDEAALCAAVNSALTELTITPIKYLPEVLCGDAECLRTLALLDPYAEDRAESYPGPLFASAITARAADADEIFCYLREGPEPYRLDEVASCLENLPGRLVAFLPGLSDSMADRLRSAGVHLLDRPAPLAKQLAKSRLVIHFGGHGMAAAALLAGVPQVILDFDIEKYLIAGALTRRGIALRVEYLRAGPDVLRAAILAAIEDPVMEQEAERAARDYGEYRSRDVASAIAERCERVLA